MKKEDKEFYKTILGIFGISQVITIVFFIIGYLVLQQALIKGKFPFIIWIIEYIFLSIMFFFVVVKSVILE